SGAGVGVGEQVKSDSTSLPGWSPVDALTSEQLPPVVTVYWALLLLHLIMFPSTLVKLPLQVNSAVIVGTQEPPVWLLTKCQLPDPLHVWPAPLLRTAADAGVAIPDEPDICNH